MAAFNISVALFPVVAFLAALLLMDSFRLVRPSAIFVAIVWGAAAAGASLWFHGWLQHARHVPAAAISAYIAPLTEETAKALLIVGLVATARVGVLVEAALHAFAVGTGFALVENLTYLQSMPDAPPILWMVRGLGTAMLQGATTTTFAIIAKTLADRRGSRLAVVFVPGWAIVVAIHSLFNHRLLPAVAQTLVILIVLPLLVLWVFARSERATREWIGAGMDLDLELLNLVGSEAFALTHFGRYLQQLRARTPGAAVVDMFCLLRLEIELSVQAKAMLLAREGGVEVPVDDLDACLAEREALQRSIGKTGLLALKPLQITSRKDQWHRHLLQQRAARRPDPRSRPSGPRDGQA
jgi:RsiW-degrading membrane proteinase PrsW (M82 family)